MSDSNPKFQSIIFGAGTLAFFRNIVQLLVTIFCAEHRHKKILTAIEAKSYDEVLQNRN